MIHDSLSRLNSKGPNSTDWREKVKGGRVCVLAHGSSTSGVGVLAYVCAAQAHAFNTTCVFSFGACRRCQRAAVDVHALVACITVHRDVM
jgi:hypothetical protein